MTRRAKVPDCADVRSDRCRGFLQRVPAGPSRVSLGYRGGPLPRNRFEFSALMRRQVSPESDWPARPLLIEGRAVRFRGPPDTLRRLV